MLGLQMDMPLLISDLIAYAARYHGGTAIAARDVDGSIHRTTYAELEARSKRLASALETLGIGLGDRVASLAWNTHRHLELLFGVPGRGAVLHTVNSRLSPEQIALVVNQANDQILFFDAATAVLAAAVAPKLHTVRTFVFLGPREQLPAAGGIANLLCYEDLIAAESADFEWPVLDERAASTICHTSGTTGDPKGIVHSHRSTVLAAMMLSSNIGLGSRNAAAETLMPLAPIFHGNAWCFPYIAAMHGARLVLPGRSYEPAAIQELISGERVTIACGVPTIWIALAEWLKSSGQKIAPLRLALSSGSSAPRSLIETFDRKHAVELAQVWGMAEVIAGSSPVYEPATSKTCGGLRTDRRAKAGRTCFGVSYRLVDDEGQEVPHDGVTPGHLRIKSPWSAGGYLMGEAALDEAGWLVTGDIATIDASGHIAICDRAKDVIKSGGEWISSIALEGVAASHPEVLQAAVIGVDHPRWQERPLLVVQRRAGSSVKGIELREFMGASVVPWWLPDDVVFVASMPMTGTGKIDKKALRQRFASQAG